MKFEACELTVHVSCKLNEEYRVGSLPEPDCSLQNPYQSRTNKECFCVNGYVRRYKDGPCVPKMSCPSKTGIYSGQTVGGQNVQINDMTNQLNARNPIKPFTSDNNYNSNYNLDGSYNSQNFDYQQSNSQQNRFQQNPNYNTVHGGIFANWNGMPNGAVAGLAAYGFANNGGYRNIMNAGVYNVNAMGGTGSVIRTSDGGYYDLNNPVHGNQVNNWVGNMEAMKNLQNLFGRKKK